MQEFRSILEAAASHAASIPDKIAIIEAATDRKCSYGELWAYVKAFSRRLNKAGIKRDFGDGYGTRVVVRGAQTIDYFITALAVHLAGGVFVPVEKSISEIRIIEIIKETDAILFIGSKPLSDSEYSYIPITDATSELDNNNNENIIFPNSETLADILYTTGTTGNSKGVMRSHKCTVAYTAVNFEELCETLKNDKHIWLLPSPITHMSGLSRLYNSIFCQCTTVLLDGYVMANAYFSAIAKYGVTAISLMAASTEMYLRTCREKFMEVRDQITYIGLSGSSFTETQINSLKNIFPKTVLMLYYGATEVGGFRIDHGKGNFASNCIGDPHMGVEVVFFNEQKNEIIESNKKNPGLFGIKSDSKMLGYWKNPELTASVTRGNYIILSDFGYRGEDGLYYFLSRADDVIISGGYKIAPLEIEEAANSFNGIQESVCVAVSDPIMGQIPKLYVVMKEGNVFNFNEIYKFLKTKLETTRIPRYIEDIEKIPKINNKVNRKELGNK